MITANADAPVSGDSDYIQLDSQFLSTNQIANFPLYIFVPEKKRYVLFKGESTPIREDLLAKLDRGGMRPVFVPKSHAAQVNQFLAGGLLNIIDDPNLPLPQKTEKFHSAANTVMRALFDSNADTREFVDVTKHVSDTLTKLIVNEPESIVQLNNLRSYDYYTYSHCFNVCVFGTFLFQRLHSHRHVSEIQVLAQGFLLHDIGKCDVPQELVLKPGPLSDSEWEVMRNHTLKGYQRLEAENALPIESRQVALHHHEAADGSGYPHKLKRDQIPTISRICSVADVYDALTSNRPYKKRMSPFEALDIMINKMGTKFDPEILKALVLLLKQIGQVRK